MRRCIGYYAGEPSRTYFDGLSAAGANNPQRILGIALYHGDAALAELSLQDALRNRARTHAAAARKLVSQAIFSTAPPIDEWAFMNAGMNADGGAIVQGDWWYVGRFNTVATARRSNGAHHTRREYQGIPWDAAAAVEMCGGARQIWRDWGRPKRSPLKGNCTALYVAAYYGHVALLDVLLPHCRDPNEGCGTATPCHAACVGEYIGGEFHGSNDSAGAQILTALLASGADPNRVDDEGLTPLMLAASFGRRACCRALAEGAELQGRALDLDTEAWGTNYTALDLARQFDADFPPAPYEHAWATMAAFLRDELGAGLGPQGRLGHACRDGAAARARQALEDGADAGAAVFNADGEEVAGGGPAGARTAAFVAARHGRGAVLRDVLLAAPVRADPNAGNSRTGAAPCHAACRNNHPDTVAVLLAAGADPNRVAARHGATPAMVAARAGHTDCLRALAHGGGGIALEVNAVGAAGGAFAGKTALDMARANDRAEAAAFLRDELDALCGAEVRKKRPKSAMKKGGGAAAKRLPLRRQLSDKGRELMRKALG